MPEHLDECHEQTRKNERIYFVRLGQTTGRPGVITYLTGIDYSQNTVKTRITKFYTQRYFKATSGFHDHQGWRIFFQILHQFGYTIGIIGITITNFFRQYRYIKVFLRNVNTNKRFQL